MLTNPQLFSFSQLFINEYFRKKELLNTANKTGRQI